MSLSKKPVVEPEDIIYLPYDPKVDPPPSSCFICHQTGHSMRKCDVEYKGELCFRCGRRGVKMSNCPRCHKVWRKQHGRPSVNNGEAGVMSSAESEENVAAAAVVGDKCDDTDFFREIKALMDSIRHLSVETQDLVVKQAMLERREKLERRSSPAMKPSNSQQQQTSQCNGASNRAIRKQRNRDNDQRERNQVKEQDRPREQEDGGLRRGFPRDDNHARDDYHRDSRNQSRQQYRQEGEERRQPAKSEAGNCVSDTDDW